MYGRLLRQPRPQISEFGDTRWRRLLPDTPVILERQPRDLGNENASAWQLFPENGSGCRRGYGEKRKEPPVTDYAQTLGRGSARPTNEGNRAFSLPK